MELVLLTLEEYKRLEAKLAERRNRLQELSNEMRMACENAAFQVYNGHMADINITSARINKEVRELEQILASAKIVEKTETECSEIGDVVVVDLSINGGEQLPLMCFRIVSMLEEKETNGIMNASIDSPIGKAVYHKQVGDIGTYEANNKKFDFRIMEITKNPNIEETQEPHR